MVFLLVLLIPSPLILSLILWWQYQKYQLKLVSPSLSCSITFLFPSKVLVLIPPLVFFQYYSIVSRDSKIYNSASSLFFSFFFFCSCCWLLQYLVVWPRLGDRFYLKTPEQLCVTLSRAVSELCIYHLFTRSTFNFLHNSQWITLPTQSCLVSYSFCANLLHSLIMWLIVSSIYFSLFLFFFFP